jgi:hypothetical protein
MIRSHDHDGPAEDLTGLRKHMVTYHSWPAVHRYEADRGSLADLAEVHDLMHASAGPQDQQALLARIAETLGPAPTD